MGVIGGGKTFWPEMISSPEMIKAGVIPYYGDIPTNSSRRFVVICKLSMCRCRCARLGASLLSYVLLRGFGLAKKNVFMGTSGGSGLSLQGGATCVDMRWCWLN